MTVFDAGAGQAAEEAPTGPQWCALTKVCYRVGQDMNNLQKVQLAVEKYEIFHGTLVIHEAEEKKTEYLKIESNGYLLPLRHPKTGEPLFLLMVPDEGVDALEIQPPDQVLMGVRPENPDLPIFPELAPPGGAWRQAKYCGPVTGCMACCPCCWICLLGLGRGGPIDLKDVYDAPDGNTYEITWEGMSKYVGPTPANVPKPAQMQMHES
mmetsp:Transcript_158353/g.279461  ORF Transcript_158353/g.279461 Transcript_158353/m.279461 type:complete len:209 (+) Transcript_158353:98-724(+)